MALPHVIRNWHQLIVHGRQCVRGAITPTLIGFIAMVVGALRFVKDGMIYNSDEVINGRNQKRYTGKTVKEFINWDEFNKK